MTTTILTPNRRLAATLRKEYQQEQMKQGILCWPTCNILPLSTWLESVWIEYTQCEIETTPLLLTSNQENILWEEIISTSPQSQHLLQISQTAKLAQSAWELLKQWKIDFTDERLSSTEDSAQFQTWAKQFKKKCRQHNWLDRASLPDVIPSIATEAVELRGFIDIAPQLSQFAASRLPQSRNEGICHRIALIDKEKEILTLARWAKGLYDQQLFSDIKIGCIIPTLEKDRNTIETIFSDVFSVTDLTLAPFNISAGKTLSNCPLVYTALKSLQFLTHSITLDLLSHLLRSPFLGDSERESQKRALFEQHLHSLNFSSFSLKKLLADNGLFHFSTHCPLLATRLKNIKPQSNKNKPSQWANYFSETLLSLGWPGERSVNSEEYQIIQNGWLPLLHEFSKLDLILPEIHQSKALYYLTQLADNTFFQPKTLDAPIQILGTLEAAGLSFDYLWCMGLDDTQWPPPTSPNPFIPARLQKELNMPNASPDRQLAYSQKLTHQFIQSSPHVIFSYSQQNEKSMLRPSTLIKSFPLIDENQLFLKNFTSSAQIIFDAKTIEHIEDNKAPPTQEDKISPGGAALFKLQAACPFKAFSELRLNARFIETPKAGLRAMDRGKILHKILELFWKELKNSEQLHALPDDLLKKLMTTCIQQSFEQIKIIQDKEENFRYLLIEKMRFEKLLAAWILVEKSRPPFEVIACEKEQEITLGSCRVNLRIDRIDDIDGERLIIDYKTGKNNSIKNWFGKRPDEPQMPLYCMTDPIQMTGIAFAELHPDTLEFKGISKNPLNFSNIKPIAEVKQSDVTHWHEQINQWQQVLTQLGEDFHQGLAHVDPKDPDETCRHCHLHSLCRIYETH